MTSVSQPLVLRGQSLLYHVVIYSLQERYFSEWWSLKGAGLGNVRLRLFPMATNVHARLDSLFCPIMVWLCPALIDWQLTLNHRETTAQQQNGFGETGVQGDVQKEKEGEARTGSGQPCST